MTHLQLKRPGYQQRKRKDGSYARYWNPRRALAGASKALPLVRIPDSLDDYQVALFCRQRTDELRADIDNLKTGHVYNGKIAALVQLYRTSPTSPYQELKASTRKRDYDPSLRLIEKSVGERAIHKLRGSDFKNWYSQWAKGGKVRRAHGAIRKLRAVLSFGVVQKYPACTEAREILSLMRFKAPKARTRHMTYDQAGAICLQALKAGRPSIALTTAMQWDTALRRIHIIGEWVPVQPGDSGNLVRGRTKWQGPTVGDITDNIFLPPNQESGKAATGHDLATCPLVQFVLGHSPLPQIGPLIVSERTGLPYRENYYAHDFRAIAQAAGVPDDVWSMDARAGAITEAEQATDINKAQKMAGHTSPKTTQNYVRGDGVQNNREVAKARSKLHR